MNSQYVASSKGCTPRNIDFKFIFLVVITLILTKTSYSEIIISDDFSKDNITQYDQSHIYFCGTDCNSHKAYEFLKEDNDNQYIRLTSKVGQLSKFNKGQKKYIKDRIELGSRADQISKTWSDIIDKEIWWTFDVKLPEDFKMVNAKKITLTQLKTIEKNHKKKQCHPGMPFRINYNEKHTWIAVTDGLNNKLRKENLYKNILSYEWSNFKIGYRFSRKDGWVKVFKDNNIIFNYSGNTIFDKYKKCIPSSHLQTFVRIGVYRETKDKNVKNDSLDFDNFYICTGLRNECDDI